MKIYLASIIYNDINGIEELKKKLYCLDSFYYIRKKDININDYKSFILDSGAFTYMNTIQETNKIDWDQYIEEYGKYILKNKIENYLELDIDNIVGIKEVERLRKKTEVLTNQKCIPVWHKGRGKEKWLDIIREYDYVAIGGIATKEIKKKEYKYLEWFINEARKNKCKVHGLGFTNQTWLKKLHFYSVDSTTWLRSKYGSISIYDNEKHKMKFINKGRLINYMESTVIGIKEWKKFSDWAEVNL